MTAPFVPLPLSLKIILYPLVVILGLIGLGAAVVAIVLSLAWPNLPSLEVITDYRPKVPLRVYTADGFLIGEFGEERRRVVHIADVPPMMKSAILAAEDDRFYQHGGLDYFGILRAAGSNFLRGGKQQGASTITQQVARNFFLTREKTYTRKLYEALLSFKIENSLSKDQILELYINQIFLGQRAYGFAAAARIYFGKTLNDLNVGEMAMLAGLPKAPSAYNPIINPRRARLRQEYVLRRMYELKAIDQKEYEEALNASLTIKRELAGYQVHGEYVAEMARQRAAELFPDDVYTRGLKVYTTVLKSEQEAAYNALRKGVLDYDRRHGYRGAEAFLDMNNIDSDTSEEIDLTLQDYADADDLIAGLVLSASPKEIKVYHRGGGILVFTGDDIKFVRRFLDNKVPANKRIQRGAIVRVRKDEKDKWHISQLPEVESAFAAVDPRDGSVRALVGGVNFHRNKFNHVTQAWRQPGSSFKPFIFSAAFEKGYTPGSIVSDDPIVVPGAQSGGAPWKPHNYDHKYDGPMDLRTALARSKNMVSIRLLQSISPSYAQDFVTRFGFDAAKHPPYLTTALGAGSVTPWQMVKAYSVFANGGFLIEPFIVKEIVDEAGAIIARHQPTEAGNETLRTLDARNAFMMDSMLRGVTTFGTAARASVKLKRRDLAGKTGTTNEYVDAWFCGYQMTRVGCAWMGFDQPRKLGGRETGGVASMPIWIEYMAEALRDVPQQTMVMPQGLVASGEGRERNFIYAENVGMPQPGIDETLLADPTLDDTGALLPLPEDVLPLPTPASAYPAEPPSQRIESPVQEHNPFVLQPP